MNQLRNFYPRHRTVGFSLIEIAIAVAIIGILAALAIPAYIKSKDSAKIAALQNDLRVYEQDFEQFELKNQSFPPSQPIAGQFPVGMEEIMPDSWKLPSPIGGAYRWVYTTEENPADRSAYIEIINTAEAPIHIDIARLQKIDDALDDGDISSGRVRLSGLNVRYYVRL